MGTSSSSSGPDDDEHSRPFLFGVGGLSHLVVEKGDIFPGGERTQIVATDDGFVSFDKTCHAIEQFLVRCARELPPDKPFADTDMVVSRHPPTGWVMSGPNCALTWIYTKYLANFCHYWYLRRSIEVDGMEVPTQTWKGAQLASNHGVALGAVDRYALQRLSPCKPGHGECVPALACSPFTPTLVDIMTNRLWTMDIVDFGTGKGRFKWKAAVGGVKGFTLDGEEYAGWRDDVIQRALAVENVAASKRVVSSMVADLIARLLQDGHLAGFHPSNYYAYMTGDYRRRLLPHWEGHDGRVSHSLDVVTSEQEAEYANQCLRAVVLVGNVRGHFVGFLETGKGSAQGRINGGLVANHFGTAAMQRALKSYVSNHDLRQMDAQGVRNMLHAIACDNREQLQLSGLPLDTTACEAR